MSGIEIGIGVVSVVAALITAYKDGHKIADRIKKKRAQRGGLPPSEELEKALKQGEQSITRLRDEGADVQVDDKAAQALKDLIIEVQGSLLHQLAEAEQDDNITDFSSVTNTAIRTRRKAETVLNQLYLRAEELPKEPAPPSPQVFKQPTARTLVEEGEPKESRLKFWRRSSSTNQDKKSDSGSTPITSPDTAPQSPAITRQNTAFSTITRRSTGFSITSPSLSPDALNTITEDNKYGGFCKGAWRAQRYELPKAVTSSIKSFERKFHCTKCSYMLPADNRDKNHPCFDDRIYKVNDMRFRMLFLLKSHLPQKSPKDHRLYGCMLCALAGRLGRQFSGEGHLLEHISHHQCQVYASVPLVGPLSIESEGVKRATDKEFDILLGQGEDFALPPSALDDNRSVVSVPLDLPEEVFGNVWADQTPGTTRAGLPSVPRSIDRMSLGAELSKRLIAVPPREWGEIDESRRSAIDSPSFMTSMPLESNADDINFIVKAKSHKSSEM